MRGIILAPHAHTQGAVPRIADSISAGLNARGWQVEVWPWGKRSESESLITKAVSRFGDARETARRLAEYQPEFLVIKTGLDWKSVARDIALVRGIRDIAPVIILQPHGSQSERLVAPGGHAFKAAVRSLLRDVNGVFVLSREEQGNLLAFMPELAVNTVKNPYDPSWIPETHSRASGGGFEVLFVGRVVAEKGVMELIAASKDDDGRGALEVTIVGNGPAFETAGEEAPSNVTFVGYREPSELGEYFARASVLALPSYSEGFPTVVAEAMGCGLPIVCTHLRGAADYLSDGVNALFVRTRDSVDLRDKLIALRDDPELQVAMGRANRELVGCFAPGVVVEEYAQSILALTRSCH